MFSSAFTVIGHRGARGHAPENTLLAIDTGIALGAPWVEFDVQRHPSGALLVFHDLTLDRTTNGHGFLADQPLAVGGGHAAKEKYVAGLAADRRSGGYVTHSDYGAASHHRGEAFGQSGCADNAHGPRGVRAVWPARIADNATDHPVSGAGYPAVVVFDNRLAGCLNRQLRHRT